MTPMATRLVARDATPADAEAIARIYNQGIEDRCATFETRPRTAEEIRAWFEGSPPLVVVEEGAAVIAFASSSRWRARDCYRGILEFSVYVARESRGKGAGRIALASLVDAAQRAGYWKLLGALFRDNAASARLMRALGFREVGYYEKQATLDGVWKDVLLVELVLPQNPPE